VSLYSRARHIMTTFDENVLMQFNGRSTIGWIRLWRNTPDTCFVTKCDEIACRAVAMIFRCRSHGSSSNIHSVTTRNEELLPSCSGVAGSVN
jgi:hypothetical protein